MTNYLVKWEIDIDADTPEEAAQKAREAQHPITYSTVFDIYDEKGEFIKQVDVGDV